MAARGQRRADALVDRDARTTLGNASGGWAARRLAADEVVLVTSSWHARRASSPRAALLGLGSEARVATTPRPRTQTGLRELASWTIVPLLALVAARTR